MLQYPEAFFENGIEYKVFAVADADNIKNNSGIELKTDDTVAHLQWHADDFDALVFSCGDAMPVFGQYESEQYNMALLNVIREFANKNKLKIGHCAAALVFELAGVDKGKRLAVHPLAKPAIREGVPTDAPVETDGHYYTAQSEHTIPTMMPEILKALK